MSDYADRAAERIESELELWHYKYDSVANQELPMQIYDPDKKAAIIREELLAVWDSECPVKIVEPDGREYWKMSPRTLNRLQDLYDSVRAKNTAEKPQDDKVKKLVEEVEKTKYRELWRVGCNDDTEPLDTLDGKNYVPVSPISQTQMRLVSVDYVDSVKKLVEQLRTIQFHTVPVGDYYEWRCLACGQVHSYAQHERALTNEHNERYHHVHCWIRVALAEMQK